MTFVLVTIRHLNSAIHPVTDYHYSFTSFVDYNLEKIP